MQPTNKIIFNTGILYSRLIIGMGVGLFTTRIVLNALGETDFGIYALVAGVIGMLSFLNASMSGVSMRFISISLGRLNNLELNKTFNSTLFIHILIGLIVASLMIVIGLFLFDGILNIPEDRIFAARIVYYLMILSAFITVVSVPFDALISAHEDFTVLSAIEILGVIIHLVVAIYISSLTKNQLIYYGTLIAANHLLVRILKQFYCRIKYKNIKVQIRRYAEKATIKEIISFTGWKTLDSSAAVLYDQMKGVLINVFFGVALNAANGIAKQVSGQLQNLSASLLSAINPQLYKSEGSGDRGKMIKLTMASAKLSFFLMSIFALPIILEMQYILSLWLINVPEYATVFCRLMLIDMIISKYTFPINTAIAATGKVRSITIVVLINRILQFAATYYLFTKGFQPQSIYFVAIVFSVIAIFYKLYFGKVLVGINVKEYLKSVIFRGSLPVIITLFFISIPVLFLEPGIMRISVIVATSLVISSFLIYWIGLTSLEKLIVKNLKNSIIGKFNSK